MNLDRNFKSPSSNHIYGCIHKMSIKKNLHYPVWLIITDILKNHEYLLTLNENWSHVLVCLIQCNICYSIIVTSDGLLIQESIVWSNGLDPIKAGTFIGGPITNFSNFRPHQIRMFMVPTLRANLLSAANHRRILKSEKIIVFYFIL